MHLLTSVTLLVLTWLPCASSQRRTGEPDRRRESAEPLRLRIESPRTVRRGDPIPIDLVLTNTGRREVIASIDRFLADSQPSFVLVIATPGGTPIWRRPPDQFRLRVSKDPRSSRSRATASGVQMDVRLVPGASYRLHERWQQDDVEGRRVALGTYMIRGSICVGDRLLSSPAREVRITE